MKFRVRRFVRRTRVRILTELIHMLEGGDAQQATVA